MRYILSKPVYLIYSPTMAEQKKGEEGFSHPDSLAYDIERQKIVRFIRCHSDKNRAAGYLKDYPDLELHGPVSELIILRNRRGHASSQNIEKAVSSLTPDCREQFYQAVRTHVNELGFYSPNKRSAGTTGPRKDL